MVQLGAYLSGEIPTNIRHFALCWSVLQGVEVIADVGGMFKGNPVGDGTLRNGGAKPVGMSDDPVGHKAAVGAAGHAHAGGVDHGIGLEHDVGKLHQVVVVIGAVMAQTSAKASPFPSEPRGLQ